MHFETFQMPLDPWHAQNFFLALPDDYDQTKTYPLVVFYGGKGSAGTDANRMLSDPGLSNQIAILNKQLQAVNPITGELTKFIAVQMQDQWGAPYPDAMGKALKQLQSASTVKASVSGKAIEYKGHGIKIDPKKVLYTGLSMGGAACALEKIWDEAHAASGGALLSIAPMGDVLSKKQNWPLLGKYKVPTVFVTGSKDTTFLGYANDMTTVINDNGGNAICITIAGRGHEPAVWNGVYSGAIKIPYVVKNSPVQLTWLEWFLAAITEAESQQPGDPQLPEFVPNPGSWVKVKNKNSGNTYMGITIRNNADKTSDVFCFDLVQMMFGLSTAALQTNNTNYYYDKL